MLIMSRKGIKTIFHFSKGGFSRRCKLLFKSWDLISDIFPWELTLFREKKFVNTGIQIEKIDEVINKIGNLPIYRGIQIETTDNALCTISFNSHEEEKIINILKNIYRIKWNKIYHKDRILSKFKAPGEIGQILIHHRWKYYGFWRGWRK